MKYKITLSIVLILITIRIGFSQDNTTFFKNYKKISATIGYDRFRAKTTLTPTISGLTYKYMPYNTGHFGLNYDVLQTRKFNFKVGLIAIRHREIEYSAMENNLIPFDLPEGFAMLSETSYDFFGSWQIDIPLTAEYIYPINKRLKLSVNTSFVIGFQDDGGGEGGFGIEHNDESADFFYTMSRPGDPFYFNYQLGSGIYFTFNKLMIRTNFFYNLAFQNILEGVYRYSNSTTNDVKIGRYKLDGNYFGAEISIYLPNKKNKITQK